MGVLEGGWNGLETDWYGLETAGVNSVGVKNGVDVLSVWYGVETGDLGSGPTAEGSGPGRPAMEQEDVV